MENKQICTFRIVLYLPNKTIVRGIAADGEAAGRGVAVSAAKVSVVHRGGAATSTAAKTVKHNLVQFIRGK